MLPLRISLYPHRGNNPRNYSILSGIYKAFQKKQVQGEIQLDDITPDFLFTLQPIEKKSTNARIVFYDLEGLYQNLDLKHVDIIFTVEENAVNLFKQKFNCSVFHLPLGFDPEVYKPVNCIPEFDISFCGTLFDPRPKVLEWLVPLSDRYKVQILTPTSWASRLKNCRNLQITKDKEWIDPIDMVSVFSKSKVILCINRAATNANGTINKTIGRGFGEASLKRCVFIDDSRDVSPYFIPEQEIVTFSLNDEIAFREKITTYLTDSSLRNQVATNGYMRSIKDHTWYSRISQALEILTTLR